MTEAESVMHGAPASHGRCGAAAPNAVITRVAPTIVSEPARQPFDPFERLSGCAAQEALRRRFTSCRFATPTVVRGESRRGRRFSLTTVGATPREAGDFCGAPCGLLRGSLVRPHACWTDRPSTPFNASYGPPRASGRVYTPLPHPANRCPTTPSAVIPSLPVNPRPILHHVHLQPRPGYP
jgi:hypothetical protein